jgi:hypothetical protein
MEKTTFTITATHLFSLIICVWCRNQFTYHYIAFQCPGSDSNKSIKVSEFQKLSLLSTYLTERIRIFNRMY